MLLAFDERSNQPSTPGNISATLDLGLRNVYFPYNLGLAAIPVQSALLS